MVLQSPLYVDNLSQFLQPLEVSETQFQASGGLLSMGGKGDGIADLWVQV